MTIAPSIWCNNNAEELASFYTSAFSDTKIHATTHYPHEGLLDFQQHLAGKALTIDLEILGTHFIAINAGPEFSLNPALSFMVLFSVHTSSDPQAELETLWEHLTADGTALMPLADYPFSPLYGWCKDQFGVSWQIAPRNVDSLMDKPAAYSAMMGMKKIDIAALHEAAQER
ncbi:VOC family protein [Jonesia quinghaiensis]|uniref:VOC family protein n=1 Tax=Jonesia quinghaiensis TaxID=262806 RepID=UPI00146F84CF|nr:VOC family protein [Jonesia quinghaiensis]